jgi:hypothetical protein
MPKKRINPALDAEVRALVSEVFQEHLSDYNKAVKNEIVRVIAEQMAHHLEVSNGNRENQQAEVKIVKSPKLPKKIKMVKDGPYNYLCTIKHVSHDGRIRKFKGISAHRKWCPKKK